jgi:hypothetical protein
LNLYNKFLLLFTSRIVYFTSNLLLESLRSFGKLSFTDEISYKDSSVTGITSISPASLYGAGTAVSFFFLG